MSVLVDERLLMNKRLPTAPTTIVCYGIKPNIQYAMQTLNAKRQVLKYVTYDHTGGQTKTSFQAYAADFVRIWQFRWRVFAHTHGRPHPGSRVTQYLKNAEFIQIEFLVRDFQMSATKSKARMGAQNMTICHST